MVDAVGVRIVHKSQATYIDSLSVDLNSRAVEDGLWTLLICELQKESKWI